MDHSMMVGVSQQTDLQSNVLTTPSRAHKRLFSSSSSSSKRSLFKEEKEMKKDSMSDAESELGGMSPLALTDQSSCDSSPGRQFVSPLATPEKSPVIALTYKKHIITIPSRDIHNDPISRFSSLRKVTQSARFSPRRKLILSPKSKSFQLDDSANSTLTDLDKTITSQEIVPESPSKESDFDDQLSYVAETPQKEDPFEQRLITPLGSVLKNIPIPRINRRKLSTMEIDECTSPEIKKCAFKRHLDDSLSFSSIKHQKTEDLFSAPRARAALFQENNKQQKKDSQENNTKSNENSSEKEKKFTLNPKSFYGSHDTLRKSVGGGWRAPQVDLKPTRRSLPACNTQKKSAGKKSKKSPFFSGVGHGIKRPKPKPKPIQYTQTKVEKQNDIANITSNESKENLNPHTEMMSEKMVENLESDKKFFKCKRGNDAVVTIYDKIKLRIGSNKPNACHVNKKAKLDATSFDTADLSVDEPAIEASLEKNKVENILKILENDWEDDYDTMETCQTISPKTNSLSPKSSDSLKDLTMSPASVLSSMASTMNIEDVLTSPEDEKNDIDKIKIKKIPTQKFYPLFSKKYTSDVDFNENNSKKRKRGTAWQLSTKYGNAENQYQIDAGQKLFGATQCEECNIIYHVGDPDDENAHLNYHNSFKTLKFQGWKNERVLYKDTYTSSRIILVEPKDSNLYWKKVNEILAIVDRDLGLSDMKLSLYRDKRVYIYIRDKTILGVLVAEYVKNAFQMIPELLDLNCCTTETTPVKCGVNVVWTAMSHRRKGIASKLVDVLRANYYYGYIMSKEDIAFSTPTPSGKQFAEKYTGTKNFKVYSI